MESNFVLTGASIRLTLFDESLALGLCRYQHVTVFRGGTVRSGPATKLLKEVALPSLSASEQIAIHPGDGYSNAIISPAEMVVRAPETASVICLVHRLPGGELFHAHSVVNA